MDHALAPSILGTLRSATRSRHATLAASSAMVRLFDPAYTALEYRTHLGRLLGLFEPLEDIVAQVAGSGHPLNALARSSALRADLRCLGASSQDIEALERCRRLPQIAAAGLYGYGYVVLGSMLGGKIIVERLRSVLGPGASFQFYGDWNGRSESRWSAFCLDLERNAKTDVPAICSTAVAIFDAYELWLSDQLVPACSR